MCLFFSESLRRPLLLTVVPRAELRLIALAAPLIQWLGEMLGDGTPAAVHADCGSFSTASSLTVTSGPRWPRSFGVTVKAKHPVTSVWPGRRAPGPTPSSSAVTL